MITGFYTALATSASVFIGILTALLASNLSNLNVQREQIERRIETIDSRLTNLNTQYEHFRDTLEEIRDQEEASQRREQAQDEVDEFLEDYVGNEFDINPDDLTPSRLQREFVEYLGVDRLNEEQHDVLQEHFEDVQTALTSSSGFMGNAPPSAPIDSEIMASNHQIEHQWQIHTEERFNRNYRRWIQTMTEIQSLRDERQRLVSRYESLDPSRIRAILRITIVTIIISVGVPLVAYLFRVSEVTIAQELPLWIEPTSIFVIWACGLIFVFKHLREQLNEGDENLPNEPDITLDEDASEAR
ncbi:hypothetical protein [Haloterrigena salina]|uniref:hypothetical protein n=1 Tax=Haloterrigena salina TaxID=504937 RepID=UPI001268348E|nr:hypothetical protein [Haloterrigena salina]